MKTAAGTRLLAKVNQPVEPESEPQAVYTELVKYYVLATATVRAGPDP
eukprot:COSAG02_NODE_74875_length_152_cov_678.377358_1_plen_47_part_10